MLGRGYLKFLFVGEVLRGLQRVGKYGRWSALSTVEYVILWNVCFPSVALNC